MSTSISDAAAPRSGPETSGAQLPPDLVAVLREARAAKWLIFKIGGKYHPNPSSVATVPKADELLRDRSREAYVQGRLAEMFMEQEKEIDIVVEALGRSSFIKLHPQFAFVLKESVPPEIQPFLHPRPFHPRIVDAAKTRLNALSKAAERAPEPTVSQAIPVEPVSIRESTIQPVSRPPPVEASSPAPAGPAPARPTAPRKPPEFSPGRPAVSTAVADVPPVPETATAAGITTSGKANPPAPADPAKRSVEEAPHAPVAGLRPVPPKPPPQPSLDRGAYEAMFGEIEDYGYPIMFDSACNRHKLENPPQEWAPLLLSPVLAAETDRRLGDIYGRRLEIARVANWIREAVKVPGHLAMDGETVRFPHFNDGQLALLKKHRNSDEISTELAAAKEARSALEEHNRSTQLHAHLRGQLGRD